MSEKTPRQPRQSDENDYNTVGGAVIVSIDILFIQTSPSISFNNQQWIIGSSIQHKFGSIHDENGYWRSVIGFTVPENTSMNNRNALHACSLIDIISKYVPACKTKKLDRPITISNY